MMLLHKAAIVAGALALTGGAAVAQGTDLGARAIVMDNYRNERALQEQAEYRVYHEQFQGRPSRSAMAPAFPLSARIGRSEAIEIARAQGVDDVERVRRARGVWMIDGIDPYGELVGVRVSARGEVLDIRRN